MKEQVTITMDKTVLAEINRIKGDSPRSFVINNLCAWALNIHPAESFIVQDDKEAVKYEFNR